jgi:hypothetical protein
MVSKQFAKYYYKSIGAVFAVILSLFVLAIVAEIPAILKINFFSSWASFFDNWLILCIKADIGLISMDELKILHAIDFIIMALFGYAFIAFFMNLWKKKIIRTIFSAIAATSPFLGIFLLYSTHSAGRTGLLTGSLIFSVLMLTDEIFRKSTAIVGIAASLTLLISVDYFSQIYRSSIPAFFIATGYILWLLWFILLIREYNKISKNY